MTFVAGVIGQPVEELDTPALVLDLPTMESNINRMVSVFKEAGVGWRPHTKGIKTPAIAHRLLAAGALGVTCAKVSEAEVMAQGGIRDILIANQIVGPKKTARLASLCRYADPIATVDSVENVRELDLAAQAWGVRLRVMIEVNVGAERCGVEPGEPVVALAKEVASRKGLRLVGLMTWESHTIKVPMEHRMEAIERALSKVLDSAAACRAAGIPVEIINCGGTPDYWMACKVKGVTEIEAGGGIFGDRFYVSCGADHPMALTVHSTVVSRPTPCRVVTDAGQKSMTDKPVAPWPRGFEGVERIFLSMEHGQFELGAPSATPRIGERVVWEPGYADLTLTMHDVLYGIRDGIVEAVWPILGRGKIQ